MGSSAGNKLGWSSSAVPCFGEHQLVWLHKSKGFKNFGETAVQLGGIPIVCR